MTTIKERVLRRVLAKLLDEWPRAIALALAPYMPRRTLRGMASYYPDARVRRRCFQLTNVVMGEDTYPNTGILVIDTYGTNDEVLVEIGNRVALAPGIIFIGDSNPNASRLSQHPYVSARLLQREKIIVEDDVWIGAGAIIMPGVRIGQSAIVGAGAVVLRDVPPRSIVAGVPARSLMSLEQVDG